MAMFDGSDATEVHFLPSVSEKNIGKKLVYFMPYYSFRRHAALDFAVLDGLGLIIVFSKNGYSFNNLAKKKIQKN